MFPISSHGCKCSLCIGIYSKIEIICENEVSLHLLGNNADWPRIMLVNDLSDKVRANL